MDTGQKFGNLPTGSAPVARSVPVWPQHVAALLATLSTMSAGIVIGWSTTALPYLAEELAELEVSQEEGSWLSSLSALGAFAGAAPAGLLADRFGRKRVLLALGAPFIVSWLMLVAAHHSLPVVYAARFIAGLGTGGSFVLAPIYNEEIAEVRIRGTLGSYAEVMLCLGVLYVFVMGTILPFVWSQVACLLVVLLFLCAFAWLPESPVYLVKKGLADEAQRALAWLRGADDPRDPAVQKELQAIEGFVHESQQVREKPKTSRRRLPVSSNTLKVTGIVYGLMILQQMSGTSAFMFNLVSVFRDAGVDMSAHVASIIVAAVQLAGGVLAALVVDRLARRLLLVASMSVMAVCLVAIAVYTRLHLGGAVDTSRASWLPLLALCVYVIAFELGIGTLPWLMMAELAPSSSHGFVCGSSVSVNWLVMFAVTKTFGDMVAGAGLAMTYGVYAVFMVVGAAFAHWCVPETSGKTREQIQHELKYGRAASPSDLERAS
ncbi:facilitated trehalose transporter Tret1-like [Bacillus rossius redtenbacheri]|uniref:facilitated trehalose transporter Tret1-like n=1 Tax=Bacillus rossius redtenbacheri TaxID=93214 RepID=UPI002FDD5F32